MEICWPGPLDEFPDPLRRHISALTDVCAQTLGTRLPSGDLAADHRASWAFGLLDSLLGSALFATTIRDDAGVITDFRISYLSKDFADPGGREAAALAGRPLLEVYPAAALAGGLYDRAVQVMATGEAQYTSGEIIAAPVAGGLVTPVQEIRIARLYDGVVITWRPAGEVERLGALLHQAQRLGRIGGWEENLLTGEVLWTEPTFALFGQPPGDPVPVAKLHAHVPADDLPVVESFRATLLRGQAGGRRRVPDHPGRRRKRAADARVRRAGHRPGRHAGRGARRLPGCVRRLSHAGGVRRDPGPAGRHRGTCRGGAPAGAAAAAGDHAAGRRAGGDRRPGHRRPLPARRTREPGQRRLVRHGPVAEQGSAARGRRYRRSRHRRGDRHGGAAELPARARDHRRRAGPAAALAEPRGVLSHRRHHRHGGVRDLRPGPADTALLPGGSPAAAAGPGRGGAGTCAAGRGAGRRGSGRQLRGADHHAAAGRRARDVHRRAHRAARRGDRRLDERAAAPGERPGQRRLPVRRPPDEQLRAPTPATTRAWSRSRSAEPAAPDR